MNELKTGIEGKASVLVQRDNTAIAYGSGGVNVFATPAMAALMEKAALSSVDPLLEAGYTTVGVRIEVKHLAATPIGMQVTATSRLVEVKGRRLLFDIEVRDEAELVGAGVHERAIIELAGFMQRVEAKAKK